MGDLYLWCTALGVGAAHLIGDRDLGFPSHATQLARGAASRRDPSPVGRNVYSCRLGLSRLAEYSDSAKGGVLRHRTDLHIVCGMASQLGVRVLVAASMPADISATTNLVYWGRT